MARLAEMLSPRAGRLVQDDTDLSGTYDVDLRWTPDELRERLLRSDLPPGTLPQFNGVTLDPNGPGLFTALQEQLGLKLEAARGRADVLVIDSVQQPSPD